MPRRWIDRDSAVAGRTGNDRGWIDSAIDIGIVADHAKHDGGIFIGGYAIVDRDRRVVDSRHGDIEAIADAQATGIGSRNGYRSTGCAFGWRAAEGACGWVVAQPGWQPLTVMVRTGLSTSLKVLAGIE